MTRLWWAIFNAIFTLLQKANSKFNACLLKLIT